MKADKRNRERLLAAPPVDTILLHGADAGGIDAAARSLLAGYDVRSLTGRDAARTPDAMRSDDGDLFGGVPAVRVDEADDSIAKPLAALLDAGGPGGRLVIRAGQLKAASRLRKLVEGHDAALAVLFTEPGPEARMALARTRLQAGAGASREAIALLGELLPADSAAATQELDKLLLFADGQAIDADMVRCAVGDAAADRIDNALIAAFDGDAAGASRAWRRLEADGTAAMQLIRAAGNHLHQLLQITSAGTSPPQAVAGLRPPAFGPRRDALLRHARSWPQASLMRALARVDDAELAFKRGRLPERLAGRHLYWMLAMHARQLNKGQRR